jgi:hypothetical protein
MTDKTEIASKFNTFYLAQHKLKPNQKKEKKRYTGNKMVRTEEMAISKTCSQKNSQWKC